MCYEHREKNPSGDKDMKKFPFLIMSDAKGMQIRDSSIRVRDEQFNTYSLPKNLSIPRAKMWKNNIF